MAQNVLTHTGHIVPHRSLCHLTMAEENMESEKAKRIQFDTKIKSLLGDSLTLPPKPKVSTYNELDLDPRNSDEDEPVRWQPSR